MIKLNFTVQVESDGRNLYPDRDWRIIAKRIARAAKGRSRFRSSSVCAGRETVTCSGDGTIKIHSHKP